MLDKLNKLGDFGKKALDEATHAASKAAEKLNEIKDEAQEAATDAANEIQNKLSKDKKYLEVIQGIDVNECINKYNDYIDQGFEIEIVSINEVVGAATNGVRIYILINK